MSERRLIVGDEAGTALLMAIVLSTMLGMIAAVVALTAHMEVLIAGVFHQGKGALYAADGALARALLDLSAAPEWSSALAGSPSSFAHGDPQRAIDVAGSGPVVLCCGAGSLTAVVQQATDRGRTWGDNTPRWTLYAWGPASAWLSDGVLRNPFYVAVWVADDPADGDADPAVDANQVAQVYASALGPGGGRRAVRALVARPRDSEGNPVVPGVQLLSWQLSQW